MAERPQNCREQGVLSPSFSKYSSVPKMHSWYKFCLDSATTWRSLTLPISFDEIDLGVVKPRICGPTVTEFCRAAKLTPPNFPNPLGPGIM